MPGLRKCVALAETIGRIGGWQGNVYIMTDSPPGSSERVSWTRGNSNIKFVKIEPIRDGVDFRVHSAGGGGGYLKTQMFDLPDIKEDILIWHDCDKMIAQPDCINDLFADPKASLDFGPDKEFFLGLKPSPMPCPIKDQDPGTTIDGVYCPVDYCRKGSGEYANRCGDGVHVGVFAAHRKWSKPLMDEWKINQQREPSVYDRYTFWDAWKKLDSKVATVPIPWRDNMYSKASVKCVNHMSGPRVWAEENRGFLEGFLQSMCLEGMTYQDIYDVYANILKWKVGKNGTEEVILEQRYLPAR